MADHPGQLLADAVAALVRTDDVVDTLEHVLSGCAQAYPSEAVAVLARNHGGSLELLGASSHGAEELELLQIQHRHGPCVEAMDTDTVVIVAGRDTMVERWGAVGVAIADAGYHEVHAFPMHWRGSTIGGLNIFVRPDQDTDLTVGQLFADLATLAVLHTDELHPDQLVAKVLDAVTRRAVIEQAKGVLAYQHKVSLETAYAELVARARAGSVGLTTMAQQVIAEQVEEPNADR